MDMVALYTDWFKSAVSRISYRSILQHYRPKFILEAGKVELIDDRTRQTLVLHTRDVMNAIYNIPVL